MGCDLQSMSFSDKVRTIAQLIADGKLTFDSSGWDGNLSPDDDTLQEVLDKFNDLKIDMNIAGDFRVEDKANSLNEFNIPLGTGVFAARGNEGNIYTVKLPEPSLSTIDLLLVVGLKNSTYKLKLDNTNIVDIVGTGQVTLVRSSSSWIPVTSSQNLVNITADGALQIIKPSLDKAIQSATNAEGYANQANLAVEAMSANGIIYTDISTGINNTSDGDFFFVTTSDKSKILTLYKNNGGAAENTGKSIVSSESLKDLIYTVGDNKKYNLVDVVSADWYRAGTMDYIEQTTNTWLLANTNITNSVHFDASESIGDRRDIFFKIKYDNSISGKQCIETFYIETDDINTISVDEMFVAEANGTLTSITANVTISEIVTGLWQVTKTGTIPTDKTYTQLWVGASFADGSSGTDNQLTISGFFGGVDIDSINTEKISNNILLDIYKKIEDAKQKELDLNNYLIAGDNNNYGLTNIAQSDWYNGETVNYIIPTTNTWLLTNTDITNSVHFDADQGTSNNRRDILFKIKYDTSISGKQFVETFYIETDDINQISINPTFVSDGSGYPTVATTNTITEIQTGLWQVTKTGTIPTDKEYTQLWVGASFADGPGGITVPITVSGFFGGVDIDSINTKKNVLKEYIQEKVDEGTSNQNKLNIAKMLWMGTSIPDFAPYPEQIAERFGIKVQNVALTGSMLRTKKLDGTDADNQDLASKSFTRTHEEYQTYGEENGYSQEDIDNILKPRSWETKLLDNLDCDLYVFDFGYNDYSADPTDFDTAGIGTRDRTTFIGAYNYAIEKLLEQNPRAKFMIVGHYENQKRPAMVSAEQKVAEYWGCPFAKVYEKTGWSQVINPATGNTVLKDWIPDETHPHTDTTGEATKRIAEILGNFINEVY